MAGPLEGVRVLDLTAVWAGPYATRLMADMGAEVIKVEGPKSPDLLRSLHMLGAGEERAWNKSAYFNHNNRNKKGCVIDLGTARGRELFLELTAISDVVIENYRAEVLEKLGLGYEVLKRAREDIILISMPGHGKSGPERDYVGFGTNIEQVSGLASVSGYRGGGPQKTGISYGDPVAGVGAVAAVLMALLARRRTGKGRHVEVAQRENLTSLIGEQILAYQVTGNEPERTGNRDPSFAPQGCYPAAGDDQWVTISCRDDADFATLCATIGAPELIADPRFSGTEGRYANHDELDERIAAWTIQRTATESFHTLARAGLPCAPVLTVEQLHGDPHLKARRFFEPVTHADAGEWEMEAPVYRFAGRPARIVRNAPQFGEHNEYVFRDLLGLSPEGIANLESMGVTSSVPDMDAHR